MTPDDRLDEHPPTPAGRVDMHSHVLPGIDDGCHDAADSLACVRRLIDAGFVGTICTPHVVHRQFPNNTPALIKGYVVRLQEQIDQNGLPYTLWPGGEVRLAPDTIEWFDAVGVPTLGDSRAVLLDFWGWTWPDFADEVFDYLKLRGYEPILAHPERMDFSEDELARTVDRLQEIGVKLQVNCNSFTGGEGPNAELWAWKLFRAGLCWSLALDMHGPESLGTRLDGARRVAAENESMATLLLQDRPGLLAKGASVDD
ncbi:MAG: tyrosine-protein phosphatase [Planctomycetia bacterium]